MFINSYPIHKNIVKPSRHLKMYLVKLKILDVKWTLNDGLMLKQSLEIWRSHWNPEALLQDLIVKLHKLSMYQRSTIISIPSLRSLLMDHFHLLEERNKTRTFDMCNTRWSVLNLNRRVNVNNASSRWSHLIKVINEFVTIMQP